jgi:hypothetical protein
MYRIEGPAGASQDEVIQAVLAQHPEAGGATPTPEEPAAPQQKGFGAAVGKGIESLISSGRTAFGALTGSPEEAAVEAQQRQEGISRKYADQVSLDKVKEAYEKRGVLPAAGEALSQIPYAIAEQAPQLATMFGGARAGAALGSLAGPVGTVVGGLAGAALPSLVQQFGGNVERQAKEQTERGEPLSIDTGAAGAAAVPQAALDVAGSFIPFGGKLITKLTGIPTSALFGKSAAQAAKMADERLLTTLAKGTATGALAEIPTEITQQMLERAQAGLSLSDADAMREYGETAYQVGLLAPLGAAGRFSEKSAARQQVAETPPTPPTEELLRIGYDQGTAAPPTGEQLQIGYDQPAPAPEAPNLPDLMEQYGVLAQQLNPLLAQYTAAAEQQDTETVRTLGPQIKELQDRITNSANLIENLGGTTVTPEELETKHQAALSNLDTKINTAHKKLVEATKNADFENVDKHAQALDAAKTQREEQIQDYSKRVKALQVAGTPKGETQNLFTAAEAPVPTTPQAPAAPVADTGPTGDEVRRKLAIQTAENIGGQIAQLKTETNNLMAGGRGYLTDESQSARPEVVAKFAQMNELQKQFDTLTEQYSQTQPKMKMLDLFDPTNMLQTAVQNGDISAINRLTKQRKQQDLMERNKRREVEKAENDRLITSLDERLGLGGEEIASSGEPLRSVKSTRISEGPEYDALVNNIQSIRDRVEKVQGNAKYSIRDRLDVIAAEHEQKKAIYADPKATSRQKTGALRRMNTLVNEFNGIVETHLDPAIKQIQDLHTQFRKVEPAEKVSKIKEDKQTESDLNATVSALMGQKSKEAKQAARINAGDIRSLIEPSKEFKELAILVGRESDAYKTQMADMQRRLQALKAKYGPDDKAIRQFKDSATKALGETALKEGRKTPEYKEALKDRMQAAQKSYASAGKQAVKSKRSQQETKKVRHAPRELLNQLHRDFEEGIASEKEGPLYRISEGTGPAMREEEVKRLISRITDSWKIVPTITFARNFAALPDHIKKQAIKDGVENKVPGVYDPDAKTVYIVGDQMHTAEDVAATVAHEIAGHFGLREMMGDRYAKTMDDLYNGNAAVRDAANAKLKKSKNLSQNVAVEEVLAEMAETPTPNAAERSALRKIFDAIKTFFNKLLRGQVISDEAVRQIVANANRYVVEGTRPQEYQNVGVYKSPEGESLFRTRTEPTSLGSSFIAQETSAKDKFLGNVIGITGRVQFVDKDAALSAALKKGVDAKVLNSLEAQNAEYFLRFGQNTSQLAGQALTNGNIQIRQGKGGGYIYESVKGANMMDAAQALEKGKFRNDTEAEAILTAYVAGLRADVVGWDKLNYENTAKVKQEHAQIMTMLQANPEKMAAVKEAARIYKEFNDGQLDFAAQAGYLSKEKVAELKRTPYIPFYRVNSNNNVELMIDKEHAIRIGNIKDEPQLHALVGDNKQILPIFTSAVQNTFMLTDMALRNKSVQESAFLLHKMGIASVVSRGVGPANANTVRFQVKGVPHFVTIDTDLYGIPADLIVKGMEGIKTSMPAVVQMMGVPATLLRNFIVRNPAYAVRQVIRDPMTAWLTTGTDATPILSSMRELASMVAGRSETENKLMQTGAISSNVFTGDQQDMSKFLKQISTGKSGWAKLMAKADAFALQGDAATRAVVYKDSLDKGMSEQAALLRTLESMNFGRRGLSPSIQALNTMIPFFNAQIQGLDVLYRAFKGDMPYSEQLKIREKLMARGLMLAAGTIAYAAMMQDDEAYKRAKPEERYGNWFVYVGDSKEPLKIPIPFELGYLFKSLPEAVFNLAAGDEKAKDAVGGMLTLIGQSNPFQLPAAIKPLTEVALGKSFFGGDIESSREKKILTSERYRETTTEAAKLLAQLTGAEEIRNLTGREGVSAISIDHLIRGYTGGLGIALVQLANPLLNTEAATDVQKPTKPMSKQPFIGGLFQPVEGRGTLDAAYNQMEYIQQVKGTFDDMVAKGKTAEARAFMQEHVAEMALVSVSGAVQKQLGELAKQERMIRAAPNLSTERKDELLERLDQIKTKIARGSMAVYERTKDRTDRS